MTYGRRRKDVRNVEPWWTLNESSISFPLLATNERARSHTGAGYKHGSHRDELAGEVWKDSIPKIISF